jgi:hypothetical protein
MEMKMDVTEAQQLVGQVRRFGETGPVYEVISVKDNGKLAEIQIPESGEKAEVLVEHVVMDPRAD